MKQRILSFVLAIVMVALAVPVLALPAIAAENRQGFTTRMEVGTEDAPGENWPTAATKDGRTYYPVYHNGWSVGKFDAGVYTEFDVMEVSDSGDLKHLVYGKTGKWNDDGIFLYMDGRPIVLGAIKATEGTNFEEYKTVEGVREQIWDGKLDGGTGPGPYYKVKNNAGKYRNTSAFVYTYTAPYEGTIDVSIDSIKCAGTGATEPKSSQVEAYIAYFSVYVNGKMVWPTEGGSITNPADWTTYPKMDAEGKFSINQADVLKNFEVNVGDVIQFATARYNGNTSRFVPQITYHDGYNIAPSKLVASLDKDDATWPAIRKTSGISSLKQTDANWTLGEFDTTANAFAPFLRHRKDKTETWACDNGNNPSRTDDNGILLGSAYKETIGALMVGANETNLRPAYQYSALATGVANIGLGDGFMLIDRNSEPAKNASGKVAIYQNGALIGTISITSDANGVATAIGSLSDVAIMKKDAIAFVATEVADGATQILANPVVQYTSISSFIAAETTETYALAMDAASIVVGDKVALSFSTYGTRDVYQNAESVKLRIWDHTVEGEKTKDNVVAEIEMVADIWGDYSYICVYDGFAPKQMTDTVTVQAYTVIDGQEYASAPQSVNMADVAYEQYEKAVAVADDNQANLMVAVLNYGAAAQEYFQYNLDNLANKDLPEELKVIEKKEDGYYSAANVDMKDPMSPSIYAASEISSVSLVFESTIGIRVYVDVDPTETGRRIGMRYGLSSEELTGEGEAVDGSYGFTLSGIGLDDLKTTYYFQTTVEYSIQLGPNLLPVSYIGNVFTYSVEAYVARMAYETDKPELSNLLHALMNLSDAAVAV